MADVRALLKAKRQEARVNHPLAAYSASGQLRCLACGTAVKQSVSWEGHVGSKSHRVAAARLREEEARRARQAEEQERERARLGKRKAEETDEDDESAGDEEVDATHEVTNETKRMRLGSAEVTTTPSQAKSKPMDGGFPADFFSDPSKAPPPRLENDDEDQDDDAGPARAPTQPQALAPGDPTLDAEWAAFEQQVLNPPDARDTFERATVIAEPELVDQTVGMPPQQQAENGVAATVEERSMTEDERRRHQDQEDRELIMDRLLDEERAQEEADAKVTMLKQRLEALRKQREAKKAVKKA